MLSMVIQLNEKNLEGPCWVTPVIPCGGTCCQQTECRSSIPCLILLPPIPNSPEVLGHVFVFFMITLDTAVGLSSDNFPVTLRSGVWPCYVCPALISVLGLLICGEWWSEFVSTFWTSFQRLPLSRTRSPSHLCRGSPAPQLRNRSPAWTAQVPSLATNSTSLASVQPSSLHAKLRTGLCGGVRWRRL